MVVAANAMKMSNPSSEFRMKETITPKAPVARHRLLPASAWDLVN
jgi:hypothetical protein